MMSTQHNNRTHGKFKNGINGKDEQKKMSLKEHES